MLDFLNSLGKKIVSQPERVSTDTYSDAITGKVKDGKEFSEKGDLVFHGDQTATILFKGQSYTLTWT